MLNATSFYREPERSQASQTPRELYFQRVSRPMMKSAEGLVDDHFQIAKTYSWWPEIMYQQLLGARHYTTPCVAISHALGLLKVKPRNPDL